MHCNLPVGTTIKGAACQQVAKPTISPASGDASDENQGLTRLTVTDEKISGPVIETGKHVGRHCGLAISSCPHMKKPPA
jgi:hypothetical protein